MASCLWATLLACLGISLSIPAAHAQDAIVGITMAGEAYEGAPKFRLLADGRVLGTKEVSSAIDTQKGARLKLNKDGEISPAERILFKVPDIDAVSRLDIEFINDGWAGKGKHGDRNLYVLSLSVSKMKKVPTGSIVTIYEFLPAAFEAVPEERGEISSHFAALYSQGSLRLQRPPGGWGIPADVNIASVDKPQQEVPTSPEPVVPSQTCNSSSVELKGFEKNTAELSQAMLAQLARLDKTFQSKSCALRVRAYTGGGPSDAFRASLSKARAQAVVRELTRLGFAGEKIQIESAPGRGRRVVITLQ